MENKNGRGAERPRDIPATGWKEVLMRVKDNFSDDYLDVVSAGVAFYFFLSLFPLFATMIAIYGLVYDPPQVQMHMGQLTTALPQQAHDLITDALKNLTGESSGTLGWTLVLSILLSLWTANQGMKALFDGINIAYNEKITRGFIKNNAISLLLTLGGMVIAAIAAAFVIGFPAFIDSLGLPNNIQTIIALARWPILFGIIMLSISVVYKFGPDRTRPKFKWVSWGAFIATSMWLAGSLLFSLYVNNFGDFDATYGSVAAVIILMLWFQLTSLSILIGAEVNSELEHQTAKDTTIGKEKPMGERDAYHADHVAGVDDDKARKEKHTVNDRDKEVEDDNKRKDSNKDTVKGKDRDSVTNKNDRDKSHRERMQRIRNKKYALRQRKPGAGDL
jgi:membrane protein